MYTKQDFKEVRYSYFMPRVMMLKLKIHPNMISMIIATTGDKKSPVLDYDYEIFYFEELRSNTSKLYQSALLTFFGIFLKRPYRFF